MNSNLLQVLLAHRKNAVQELTDSFELANQLRAIINEPFGTDRSVEADDLIRKILKSFTDTISILNSGEVSDPILPNLGVLNLASRRSEGTEVKRVGTSALKYQTVNMKRKTPSSRPIVTPNLADDGHVWRQCRRKEVLNPRIARNYFYECNFRTSQGCQAKKLVQRTEDKPPRYQTTYTNHHTCNSRLKALPGVIFDSTTLTDSIKSAFKCPDDVLKEPSYPTSTKTHHPPVIISSYRT
ncbi:hypothetical protein Vadar_030626 [Vaccinium darrowii]|uniref:Uncharacterized protein n=1 Tax=Vaccinium darrowii TaxID=229202 RepID=A0ACB7YH73_9ERIC|nr:hypothetical protein Vadar_030626 [Vaccinium darrowii]